MIIVQSHHIQQANPAQTSKMALSVCTLRLLCVAAGSMVVGLAAAEKAAPLMVNVCTALVLRCLP